MLLGGLAGTFPNIKRMWADTAYRGLKDWLQKTLGWTLTISQPWWTGVSGFWVAPGQTPPAIPKGFHVLPRRWVVERTFAWLCRNRRLSKDYERLCQTGEMLMYLGMSRIWACLILRTSALPRARSRSSSSRSSAVSVTRYFLVMTRLLAQHHC